MEGFERLPGEDQKTFRKRYNAEVMRRRRAAARAKIAEETGQPYKRKGRGVAKRPPSNAGVSQEEWEALRQQEGESYEDWQRRYNREKTARFRKRHPEKLAEELEKRKQERIRHREIYGIKRRGKGKGPLKNSFLSQEEWDMLQQQPGETEEEREKRYFRYIIGKYRDRHYDRLKIERKEYEDRNRDRINENRRQWKLNNPDKVKAAQKRHFDKYRERHIASLKKWARENPERLAEVKAVWYQANAPLRNHYTSKYRAQKGKATPNWVDREEILEVYQEAQIRSYNEGILYAVDHIIALKGKTEEGYKVSGLHVPWNLQVITSVENSRKNNRCQQADAVDESAEAYS